MLSAAIVTETCHYCRKGRSPREIMALPAGAKICHDCYERHKQAVLAMSGLKSRGDGTFTTTAPPPPECSECHAAVIGAEVPMAVHFENGLYRLMCQACSDKYVPKRRDLYGDTAYGYRRGLK